MATKSFSHRTWRETTRAPGARTVTIDTPGKTSYEVTVTPSDRVSDLQITEDSVTFKSSYYRDGTGTSTRQVVDGYHTISSSSVSTSSYPTCAPNHYGSGYTLYSSTHSIEIVNGVTYYKTTCYYRYPRYKTETYTIYYFTSSGTVEWDDTPNENSSKYFKFDRYNVADGVRTTLHSSVDALYPTYPTDGIHAADGYWYVRRGESTLYNYDKYDVLSDGTQGAKVGTVQAIDKFYPNNGEHTDGFWYVKTSIYDPTPQEPEEPTPPETEPPFVGNLLNVPDGHSVTNSEYLAVQYPLRSSVIPGRTYTVSGYAELGSDRTSIMVYNSGGTFKEAVVPKDTIRNDGKFYHTFVASEGVRGNDHIRFYVTPSTSVTTNTLSGLRLEEGTIVPDSPDIPDEVILANVANGKIVKLLYYTGGKMHRIKSWKRRG